MVALNVQCSMFNGESLLKLPWRVVATAARLCRLLPTGRKNVVASLVIDFRLHVRQAQVVCVGVPATIHRRVQLAEHTQVRSALPLSPLGSAACY